MIGVGLILGSLDVAFIGLILPFHGVPTGLLLAGVGVVIFLIGRGVVIDGRRRKIRRWWGWVPLPVFSREYDFSKFRSMAITEKLGPKPGEANVGRMVRYPVFLETKTGKRILLKPFLWVTEARLWSAEISRIIALDVQDESGEEEQPDNEM